MEEENFYEDLVSKRDMKGSSPVGAAFMILLIAAILGFGGYITYLKFTDKKEEPKKEVEEKPIIQEEEIEEYEMTCEDECEYAVHIGEEEIKIQHAVVVNKNDTTLHKIKIGETEIVNQNYACGGPSTLKVLKDMIVMSFHEGCDIAGNSVVVYDKTGMKITSYENFGEPYNMRVENTSFDIKEDSIFIPATRVYHGPTLRLNEKKEVNLCVKDEWELYEINESTIASGTYQVKYLGNGTFQEPVLATSKTLKEMELNCEKE